MNSFSKIQVYKLVKIIGIVLIINVLGYFLYHRFDLTADKRYSLSEPSLNILKNVLEPVYIDVYLEGNYPAEFNRLHTETQQLLEEFSAYNNQIVVQFINPVENEEDRVEVMKKMFQQGIIPLNVTVNNKGKQSQEVIYPWAMVTNGKKTAKVALLKNILGAGIEQKIVSSVQHLEYAFVDAIQKVSVEKQKKIAVLKGNGELSDAYIADFLKTIKDQYYLAPFTLDSVENQPIKTLEDLQKYDLTIVAKPTQKFTDNEKQVLDQFVMNGGKTLWLVDGVRAEMDSLYNPTGEMLAYTNELNLNDLFFKYGFRINPLLVKDEQATPIKLATGQEGSQTQYSNYNWKFSPYIYPKTNHPIIKNTDGLKLEFASPIDTLNNGIKKTVLLETSKYSKKIGTPSVVSLAMVEEPFDEANYKVKDSSIVGLLLEGKFTSVYQNRVLPFEYKNFISKSKNQNKMIVVSDGEIIKNQLDSNLEPLELGYDKWTKNFFGNKEFLLNSVNYLLDDKGLLDIRSKDVDLPILNRTEVSENYTKIQLIAVGIPLLFLLIFGTFFYFLRLRYKKV